MCILMGKRLAVFLNSFLFTSKFLGLKMQKSTFFLRKMVLRVVFFINKIDVYVVTNWSVRLEKHQTVEILLMVDFYAFLKMLHFHFFFRDF